MKVNRAQSSVTIETRAENCLAAQVRECSVSTQQADHRVYLGENYAFLLGGVRAVALSASPGELLIWGAETGCDDGHAQLPFFRAVFMGKIKVRKIHTADVRKMGKPLFKN